MKGGRILDIQKLIDDYASWLKQEITFEKVGEYYEITTPYLDNANDYLQIYVRQIENDIYFTDDSATIRNLKMEGFQFTAARKKHLQRILNQYGVKLEGDELTCKAPVSSFAQKKHLFIQAMLRIDDMFTISKAKVSSLFLDDIQEFFSEKDIFYSDNVQFTGISGFSHNYDFLLQRSKTKPERRNDSQLIVILNDQNTIAKGIEDAFLNYEAKVVRWSERNKDSNLQLFAAS